VSLWQALRQPDLPRVEPLAPWLDRVLCTLLALLGFFLPVSVAAVSLLLVGLLAVAVLAGPALWRSRPWRDPVIALGLLLFMYIGVHTLWTSGFAAPSWKAINRYHELAVAAVLLVLFRLAGRPGWFLQGLVAGALFYACAHWLGLVWRPMTDYLKLRHISAGFNLALSAFVLLALARGNPRPWPARLAAAFLAATVFFAVDGRTGHLVMLLLIGCAAWLYSPARWRWAATIVLPALALAIALGSSAVQKRVDETVAGSSPAATGDLSSTGIRIELMRNGLNLASQYGLVGGGYAEYLRLSGESALQLYGNDPRRRAYLDRYWVRTENPHNEYLMQLVGGGAAALLLFLAWLVAPMLRVGASRRVRSALIGIGLAFAFGCLFNSLLMDFVEGHFYVVLMTWLLARSVGEAAPAHAAST
jgi:O-antigen ligase